MLASHRQTMTALFLLITIDLVNVLDQVLGRVRRALQQLEARDIDRTMAETRQVQGQKILWKYCY